VKVPYIGPLPLRAENEHRFFMRELQFEFAFDWDTDGRIHAMQFSPGRGQPMFPLPRKRG
jgi:hypothetical protein